MKPILILPPDQMSPEDMERLRENDICVVVAKDPAAIRFCDPPPSGDYDQIVEASLNLSRTVMANPKGCFYGHDLATQWAKMLMDAQPLRKAQVEQPPSIPKNKSKR